MADLAVYVQTMERYHGDLQFVLLFLFLAGLVLGAEWVRRKGLV